MPDPTSELIKILNTPERKPHSNSLLHFHLRSEREAKKRSTKFPRPSTVCESIAGRVVRGNER